MTKEPEIQEVSGDESEPLTKGEFNEAMRMVARSFETMATKQDLKQFATKDELRALETRLQVSIERVAGRIEHWGREIMQHIDVAVENRQIDLGAAKQETVLQHGAKLADHEARLGILERLQGIPQDS